ncbi:sensor histidine kinase inhibitor, KipI family [Roseateles sp. YR242]|uniref:5-oxoprolinase subunit B/C family protein n=1 Tax=Roseateles sp. YR242 TaxID=1855305 RepID=UPI0008CDCDCE|nr:urea amidolyase family protein [Roseateles sp. YR242]SEL11205.1 sensor histidine kinase inhibitor, KipI family [Roseateles sp. YR242]
MMNVPSAAPGLRLLPAGDAVLVELADLPQTLGLLASLQAEPVAGLVEIVPGARTLLLTLDPWVLTREALAAELARRPLDMRSAQAGPRVDIPVFYDGEDLAEVATLLKITPAEVVRRHTGSDWFVAFTGFAPGFAYLTGGDELLRQLPRRASPRTRIPPGAVAAAGGFSGVYPKASPGGWRLLGQTPLSMWDLQRNPPALLQPGQRVRFVDAGPRLGVLPPEVASQDAMAAAVRTLDLPARPAVPNGIGPDAPFATAAATPTATVNPVIRDAPSEAQQGPGIEIRNAGLQSLLQDLGRPGQAGQGVAASGAMDRGSLKAANRLVGNLPAAACIEVALGGFELVSQGDIVVAVTGAEGPLTLIAPDGRRLPLDRHTPQALSHGDRLLIGDPTTGVRSYVALRGGVALPSVLGSLSYDSLADVGPAPLQAGDRLLLNSAPAGAVVGHPEPPQAAWPRAGDEVTLDIRLGPRTDWFTAEAVETLTAQTWTVTPQSNRVGLRVQGARPLARAITAELPSEGTARGAIQVPASGQPVLFLADHPLTGGYPVIACIAPWHLDLAGQMPVGTRVRLHVVAGFEPVVVPR